MTGRITKAESWMNYYLHIDGVAKPKRIYFRNHNNTYIKQGSAWVRVYFNYWLLESSFSDIPMTLNPDGEWEMMHEYEQLDCPGALYAVKGERP